MAQHIMKIQKNKNITLPAWILREFRVAPGDYVQLEVTKQGVLLKPAKLVDPSQAYFWTKDWQKGEAEVQKEIRKGRVKKARTVKGLIKDLRR